MASPSEDILYRYERWQLTRVLPGSTPPFRRQPRVRYALQHPTQATTALVVGLRSSTLDVRL
jgi:hypothetical protein